MKLLQKTLFVLSLVLFHAFWGNVLAQDASKDSMPSLATAMGDTTWVLAGGYQDFGKLGTSPARIGKTNWKVWLGVSAGVALSFVADRPFQKAYDRSFDENDWPNELGEKLSYPGNGLAVLGGNVGWYLLGHITQKEHFLQSGAIGIESTVLTGFYGAELKFFTGRERPGAGLSWRGPPGSLNEYSRRSEENANSFPSGHSLFAWSWASVMAWSYRDKKWVPPLAYGIASAVSIGRLAQNEHWVSDVAVGSLMGYAIGRFIAKRRWGTSWTIFPSRWNNNLQLSGVYKF